MAKYLIIGGVAGGASAAARLRRLDEKAEIILFERGEHISYANCGLPYYIGGTIRDRNRLFVQTPQSFEKRFNLKVATWSEVTAINKEKKEITVKNIKTDDTYTESYDKLILSPGAEPVRPPIPGINEDNIFTMRNVADTDKIKTYMEQHHPRRAIVIGAGFIGLEMAENLHRSGIFVTIVEMSQQVMTPLDYEMAAEVHQHLKTKGVEFYLNDGVAGFKRDGNKTIVTLKSGRNLPGDMVILSIGVRPETKLAKDAGLEIGEARGIAVNEYLQTSDPDIYAVGDAIEFENPIIHKKLCTYLAGPANKQARIMADNIVKGNKRKYNGSISTAVAKVFDLTVASTGVSEKVLKKEGIPYQSSITHSASHAGYYPDAMPMSIKIQFSDTDGKVLGAQIVGYDGVDKRIDMIASVIKFGGTVYDLQELEQAYAPPYSSAKDPVNIAGFAAENILKGDVKIIHWDELEEQSSDDICLINVASQEEFRIGTIEGSVSIPIDELRTRLSEVPQDKKVIIFCAVGLRGYLACRILLQNGFPNVYNLSGGYSTYKYVTQKQDNTDVFEKDFIHKDDSIYQADPEKKTGDAVKTIEVDACGLQCPGPIMRLKKEMDNLHPGERIKEIASDPGFYRDVESWCKITGNQLVSRAMEGNKVIAVIEKQQETPWHPASSAKGDHKTLVVFSNDLDRAMASFVIANGAASTGKKVVMFFTFWGLNILRKRNSRGVKKDLMGKMFGMMMPKGSKNLSLSKMHMGGMGTMMMRGRMNALNVDSLEKMIEAAQANGVQFIACQMSMDVMGIKKEELLDGVTIGGVATYLKEAEQANLNLFV